MPLAVKDHATSFEPESPLPKYNHCQVWSHLIPQLCRRLQCEKLTVGRQTTDAT